MTHDHNHLDNNNPLAEDLFNPLAPELGEKNVDLGLRDLESSIIELTNSESEELSLIEEMLLAQRQDDDDYYEGSLFNNRPRSFSSNYNNYSGGSYTGIDDDFSVNQDATNSQANDFGSEVVAQGTGLTGEYFDKTDLSKSILTRTDTNIDFNWQKGSPDSVIKKNTFSVRWTGQIEATQNEAYTFYTQADDGVRLWVNNELIIDDWQQHGVIEQSGSIDLEAGQFYDIKLEYFENKGEASVSLLWSSESQAKEVIPTSFLYPEDYLPTANSVEPITDHSTAELSSASPLPIPTPTNTNFSILAEGEVRINGSSDFDGNPADRGDDALMYAGKGFTLNGNLKLPVVRDETGNVITDGNNKEVLVDRAVAVSSNYLYSNASNNNTNRYSGLVPPQIVDTQTVSVPDYHDLLSENLFNAIPTDAKVIDFNIRSSRMNNLSQWQQKFPAPGTPENPRVVKVTGGGLNIPSQVDLSNYVIIVERGSINFNGSGHDLDNVVLVAQNGNINLSKVSAHNSSVFASQTINMNGQARFSGESLIANGQGNITFDGATATTQESDLLTVISAGDITFNGSSATRGQFLTARDFTYNGNSTLYGAIAAKQNITFNGGGEVIATAAPQVTVENLTIVEGDDGSKSALVTVNLSRRSILTTELNYTTVDGTAVSGVDYEAVAGKLSFEPLETTKTIEVAILGDKIDEIDEAFTIELDRISSTVTITDDDAPPEIVIGDLNIVEGDVGTKTAFVTVTLSNPSSFPIAVDYTTEDNTAEAGVDYGAVSGRLDFAPGEASKVISVPIINDSLDEVDKELIVKLANPNNATIADDRGTIRIEDNDEAPDLSISSELVTEGDTGIKQAEFTVMLSNPSGKEISVDFNTVEGTASARIDYTAIAGTLTFAPGEISKTITVDILGDNLDEIDEAFTIELANPNNVTLSNNLATGTIIDNDLPPEISIENIEVTEGNEGISNATITINLDRPSSLPISVDYATEDNTAVAGSDYNTIAGTVDFAPGETSKTISIEIVGDLKDEYDETLAIDLTNASNATIATNTGTVTILDDDALALVSVGDITLVEGNEGSTNALFTVSLDVESAKPISIDFTTVDGTAEAGSDYVGVSGKLEFAPGETSKTIEVAVLGDKLDELDEAFTIHLSNPINADILNNHGTGTIVNDDNPPTVTVENLTITEGDSGTTEAIFTVSLSEASGKEITIDYSTVDGDAVAGFDYEAIAGTLTFAPGETSKTIAVIVNGDKLDELDEAFFLQIENGVNVAIEETQITGTIVDDDRPPAVVINDITVTEGTNGTSTAIFTVTLDNPSSKEIILDYATADGTAVSGQDYIATNGTLTFAPGETTKAIAVTIQGDNLDELDEAFFLNFDNASNATLTDTQGKITITDDDNPPEISISDITVTEGDSDNTIATVTVTLDNPSSLPITVDYATADGSAIAGEDYLATSGTIFFAPGEISKIVSVSVIGDRLDELNEAFDLNLSNITNATPDSFTATGTIADDDLPPQISIDSVVVGESDTDTTAVLTVTLDAPSNLPVSVEYSTADETAVASEDYQATSGVITFEPGETVKTISLTVIGDLNNETDETFKVNLTNPSNATIAEAKGTVTIEDDDHNKGILLVEEDNFSVRHTQVIDIPDSASVLSITYSELNFDTLDANSINDALEVALVDDEGNSLLHTIAPQRDALFNLTEGETPDLATGVTFEGSTIKVNLSDLAAGTAANLIVRLVNNDGDVNTSVRLTDISIEAGEDVKPIAIAPATSTVDNATPIDFEAIEDVSASLTPVYGQTSFNEENKTLYAELAVQNQGTYEVRDRLLVAVKNISDPSVRAVDFDGLTPSGVPYYDFSQLIDDEVLESSETTAERTIAFVNPNGVQFDYELVFLSQINRAPEFITEADTEALAGKPYIYDAGATDPDNDVLSYSLLSVPSGMEIDAQTGEITWTPTADDLGNHAVTVQTEDGRGGEDTQTYNLSVVNNIPNRPPVFTSTPVVDGRINQAYSYDSDAVDADGDTLTYSLLDAPEGLSIDSETGEITWTPNGEQLGTSFISIQTEDGRGGVATQDFEILIRPEAGNNAPIIVSNPFTKFNLPGETNPADGNVTPNLIDLDLVLGESTIETVSLTLPEISTGQSFADIVFVVDESGSMGGEQAWVRDMVLELEAALQAEGVGENRYGLVGYGGSGSQLKGHAHLVGDELLGTAAEFVEAAKTLTLSGGTEDGYDAFNFGLDYPFRDGAAVNFILVTDEDRDVYTSSLNFTNILESFNAELALLNAVVNANFRSGTGQTALGVDFEGNAYIADGTGGFTSSPNGVYVSGSGTTKRDYVDLAWVVEGAAWNLNQLRAGGLTAASFTQAFVDIKAKEIQAQLPIDLISSDPSVSLTNLTGELSGLGGGDTATFDVEIRSDGTARSFDLLLVRPDTNIVLGSIPVTINNDYFYPIEAIDADGDVLTYSLVEAPSGANIDATTGQINWEPPTDGDYDFTVEVADGRGGIDTQAYTVTVTAGTVNVNPVIDSTAPTEALLNQSFIYNIEASDSDGDFLSYYLDDAPLGMTIERTTGQISWIPDASMSGGQSVTVRVLDGRGGEAIQTFILEVGADLANSAPTFDSAPIDTIEINQTYRYDAVASDPDNDSLDYELALAPDGMSIESSTGRLFWQPSADKEGTHTVVIKASDGRGGIDLQAFSISVRKPNVNPIITSQPNLNASISSGYTYQVRAQDSDGETVSYRLEDAPEGMVVDEATGVVSWTPTSEQLGRQSVSVTVIDDRGGETTQSFTLDVVEAIPNSAPIITSTPRTVTQLDSPYFYQLEATDEDGDRLSYSVVSAPEGMTIDEQGKVIWLPNSNQFGENEVTLQVDDGKGLAVRQSFSINVVATTSNSLPTITSTPIAYGAVVGQTYSYDGTATDPDGDLLLWNLDIAPQGMSIDPETGTLRWQPTIDQIGSHTVAVRVVDALGAYVGQEFDLNVGGANTAPNIVSTPITQAGVGQDYSYRVVGSDAQSDRLEYALIASPEGMSINSDTGEISWVPSATGSYDIEVSVTDFRGASSKQAYTVEVAATPINSVPTITSTPGYAGDVDTTYSYQVVGADADNDALSYELITAPSGMVIDSATGFVTWNSPVLGQHQVVVGVNDGQAGVAQGYTLTVNQNQAPVVNLSNPPATTAKPGEVYRYDVPAYDPNGDRLTFTFDSVSEDKGFTIDELGRLRWTPDAEDAGNHPVTITITDEAGAEIEQSFTVEVIADTEAPKIDLYPGNIFVVDGQYQTDINSTVTFQAWATDNVGVTGVQLLVNGVPVAVDRDGIANVTFNELGTVELKAIATDAAGNIGEATATVDVYDFSDVDAPTVNIDLSGIEDNIVTAPVDIIGTISDDNLDYYVLEIGPADGDGEFVELFRSSTPVTDGAIATFDPSTVANDAYSLRVTAFDNGGNFASSEETVFVEGELKLGNFQLSFTDLVVPVAGIPISVTRTYDTLTAGSQDDFGYGWRLEFRDTNLRTSVGEDEQFDIFGLTSKGFQQGDAVYITLPGGKRETFIFEPELTPAGRMLAGLASSGGYAAGGKDYGLYHPKFVSESDSNNTLSVPEHILVRGESGQFAGIAGGLYNPANSAYGQKYILTTQEGIEYEIDAVSGDLKTATDTNGNKLTFTESGITSDSGVSVTFGRDGQGRITSVIDPDGNEIKYQYDDNGDLISVTDREENTTRYGYSEERSHYLDEIIDPLGRTGVKTEYDENGRMSRLIDVNGEDVELTYDTYNSTQTIEDANSNPTTYVYDDRGNVVTEVDPVGLITKRTYDDDNNMLTETIITDESGEEGYTTTYTYDENGYETSITDPLGNTQRYDYDSFGRMLSRTDALGNTTTYTYSGRNIASVTDALGNLVSYTYDRAGNRTSMKEGENDITYYEYDSRGNRTKKTDPLGNVTTYTHDTQGNVLTETMTLTTSEGVRTLVTTRTYDSNGNETSVLDAEGNLTRYEYDANGNQTAIIDAQGRRTVNRYDEKNNLIETILPDDTPDDDSDNLRSKTTYDANGNKTSVTDFAGNTTYYSSSATDLPTGMIYPDSTPDDLSDNPTISVAYNKAGGMTSLVDESGNTATYEYDAAGRIIATRQYDAEGNLIESTTEYDGAGQVIAKTDALGRTTSYVYDALGQVIETIFHDGTSIKTEYDAFGNEIAKTDQAGNTTYYEYDALDRLTAVVDTLGQRMEYQYDEAGNLVYQKDANNHITRFEFDGIGRQTAVIRPMGQESLTLYDKVGNVISTTDFNGEIILYEYNDNNQLTKKLFEDGSTVDFNYDDAGRLESVVDERGITSYTYNERGNLLSRTEPDGKTIAYTYNDAGKLESIITDSVTTSYTYDSFNFLDKVTANGEVTDYDYDVLGNLVQTTLANGVVETREYDELYRLIGVDNTDESGNVISSYDYTLDAVGNRTLVEELGGRTVAYEYDKLYRLLTEDISDVVNGNQTLSYVYDAVGNRLSLTDSVNGLTTYTYNDNDWLLSETQAGVTTNYTYDNNGNNLTKINPDEQVTYTWNQENRLIGAEIINALGTTNLGYQYDASGVRVASTVNGIETRYLVDANREHAEVIEEYNPDGTTNVAYVHGLNMISAERGGETDYYVHDGHSGVRQLTDENGVVTDSYDYDGYGNLLNSTGDSENNYLYRGEQFDQKLGMQYLRQRYYDTSVGRFASVDPFSGLVELPVSRHRYMYGNANPITYLDPSGEISMTMNDTAAAGAIFAILSGLFWNLSNSSNLDLNGNPQQKGYWEGDLELNFNSIIELPVVKGVKYVTGEATLTNEYFGTHEYEVRGIYGGGGLSFSSFNKDPSNPNPPGLDKTRTYDVSLETKTWFLNQSALAGRFLAGDIGYTNPNPMNTTTKNEIGFRMGTATGIGSSTSLGLRNEILVGGFILGSSDLQNRDV